MRIFWLLLLMGCKPEPSVCDESSPQTSYVWNGFGYEWELLSHRLSLVKAMMTENGGSEMGLIGGDWSTGSTFSDLPMFRNRVQVVTSDQVHAVHGVTTLSLDRDQRTSVEASLEIPAGWADSSASVVLRGIRFDTDVEQGADYPADYEPGLGYTSSGLSYGIADSSVESGQVNFTVYGQSYWGPQDREDMNNAMLYAQSEIKVGWTVLFHTEARQDFKLAASADYPRNPPNSEHPPFGEDVLAFGPVSGSGFAGIREVTLRLHDQNGTNEGSYWRRIGFELVNTDSSEPYGYAMATNSSLLEELQVSADVEAAVSWFPITDECGSTKAQLTEDVHEVGEASFP